MASGKWNVMIRKKNLKLSATFSDKETAELWAKYKEDLYDEMEHFNVPPTELFKLSDAIDLKARSLKEKDSAAKTILDTLKLKEIFSTVSDKPLSDISLDDYSKICERMLNTIVLRGGSAEKGKPVQQSIYTVYKKFRYLSIVYSFMIDNGLSLANHPHTILRELERKMRPKVDQEVLDSAVRRMNEDIFGVEC
jgi:hypothetical protein